MPKDLKSTDPKRFSLTSFAELLAPRSTIPGQDPDTFEAVRAGIFASLAPMSPYECLIAENIVSIDWELLQHRRKRDHLLRHSVMEGVTVSFLEVARSEHSALLDAEWKRHVEAGGTEKTWNEPPDFDKGAAERRATMLLADAQAPDAAVRSEALHQFEAMGVNLTDILSQAYLADTRGSTARVSRHADAIMALEKRRREVLRDYTALTGIRPIEAEVIEG